MDSTKHPLSKGDAVSTRDRACTLKESALVPLIQMLRYAANEVLAQLVLLAGQQQPVYVMGELRCFRCGATPGLLVGR
jgi:hypothetical protein